MEIDGSRMLRSDLENLAFDLNVMMKGQLAEMEAQEAARNKTSVGKITSRLKAARVIELAKRDVAEMEFGVAS